MGVKETRYVVLLAPDCRRRHVHCQVGKWITEFNVQIELFIGEQWRAIVRYDTGHGFAHRDLLHGDGSVENIPLHVASFNEALTIAENDLRAHWAHYRHAFLKEITSHD